MSDSAIERIVEARTGKWNCFEDCVRACRLDRDDLGRLAAANAFAEFEEARSDALWKAEAAPLMPMLDDIDDRVDWAAETTLERIRKDFQAFRTTLGRHPIEVIKREQWPYPVPVTRFTCADQLLQLTADRDVFAFGMVLVKQSPGSARGMVFVTLEDETGFINLALTPQVYARFYRLVDQQPILAVVGRLQRVAESHSILVKRVFDYEQGAQLLRLDDRRSGVEPEAAVELVKPRAFH